MADSIELCAEMKRLNQGFDKLATEADTTLADFSKQFDKLDTDIERRKQYETDHSNVTDRQLSLTYQGDV
jgi:hypothetical protein